MEVSSPSSSRPLNSKEAFRSVEEGGEEAASSATGSMISDRFDPTVEVSDLTNGQTEPSSSNPNQCFKSTAERGRIFKRNKKVSKLASGSSGSGLHLAARKRKNPKVFVAGCGGRRGGSDFDELGLPLGMSIAAFVAQMLERKNVADESIPVDHLSSVCSSAVKESVANVFGNRFDCFVRNFEKSFGSTLKTLRLINETSLVKGKDPVNYSSAESYTSEIAQSTSLDGLGLPSGSYIMRSHPEIIPDTSVVREPFSSFEEIQQNMRSDFENRELTLHQRTNQQLTCVSTSRWTPGTNNSMLKTYEKSVMEQTRSNDLKTVSLELKMQELQLKKSQLALKSDLNYLERFKLSFGISKASFKMEKFKTQLEDTRHAELLKKSIDCFVASLFIMSVSLVYGAYVYSYERLIEITTSCNASTKESKSWWIPKQVATFNSVVQMVRCQFLVASRMLFGVFMILAAIYLLLQRPVTSQQNIPLSFLLLGVACGFAGKLCVDTLGGSGYSWLIYWEVLCVLHLFANVCTSMLFSFLYGPITVSQEVEAKTKLPFWIRRFIFYAAMLFFLPLLCGLLPFAGPGDWTNHFFLLSRDSFLGLRNYSLIRDV